GGGRAGGGGGRSGGVGRGRERCVRTAARRRALLGERRAGARPRVRQRADRDRAAPLSGSAATYLPRPLAVQCSSLRVSGARTAAVPQDYRLPRLCCTKRTLAHPRRFEELRAAARSCLRHLSHRKERCPLLSTPLCLRSHSLRSALQRADRHTGTRWKDAALEEEKEDVEWSCHAGGGSDVERSAHE